MRSFAQKKSPFVENSALTKLIQLFPSAPRELPPSPAVAYTRIACAVELEAASEPATHGESLGLAERPEYRLLLAPRHRLRWVLAHRWPVRWWQDR